MLSETPKFSFPGPPSRPPGPPKRQDAPNPNYVPPVPLGSHREQQNGTKITLQEPAEQQNVSNSPSAGTPSAGTPSAGGPKIASFTQFPAPGGGGGGSGGLGRSVFGRGGAAGDRCLPGAGHLSTAELRRPRSPTGGLRRRPCVVLSSSSYCRRSVRLVAGMHRAPLRGPPGGSPRTLLEGCAADNCSHMLVVDTEPSFRANVDQTFPQACQAASTDPRWVPPAPSWALLPSRPEPEHIPIHASSDTPRRPASQELEGELQRHVAMAT